MSQTNLDLPLAVQNHETSSDSEQAPQNHGSAVIDIPVSHYPWTLSASPSYPGVPLVPLYYAPLYPHLHHFPYPGSWWYTGNAPQLSFPFRPLHPPPYTMPIPYFQPIGSTASHNYHHAPQLDAHPRVIQISTDSMEMADLEGTHPLLKNGISQPSSAATDPIQRTPWVMWMGNLPSKTTDSELESFLSGSGVVSIFVITHSCCAFVNFDGQQALQQAIGRFNGTKLRPDVAGCPLLICKERTSDDAVMAGVGGQRVSHIHKNAVRQGANHPTEEYSTATKELRPALSQRSSASSSSSFLADHFPERFFILKSFTSSELEGSVRTQLWATQIHNEEILEKAFRTSQRVYLFFSENGSGKFFGYARMASGVSLNSETKPSSKASLPSTPFFAQSPSPSDRSSSATKKRRVSDPNLLVPKGTPFKIEWVTTKGLSFKKTRHITNPWMEGREVKISRDGTELHPSTGRLLMEAWDKLEETNSRPASAVSSPRRI